MSNGFRPKPERLACLIASRNLGDIVICSGLLAELIENDFADRYVVWTRPQAAWMFKGLPNCEVVCSQFPVGTMGPFGARQLIDMVRAALRIRRMQPSVSLDFVGDQRERFFGRMIRSARHLHIGWAPGHPHNRLIRNPFGPGKPFTVVPASVPNAYAGYQLMMRDLLAPRWEGATETAKEPALTFSARPQIGLHPFASQACKLWPIENWRSLAKELLSLKCSVVAFASPAESEQLQDIFGPISTGVRFVTGTLSEFADAVRELDLMVGLDSFSVHMAHRLGVASITINAGAPPELWAIPNARTLASSGGCVHHPCFNVAPCRKEAFQYACVKAITPAEVLAAVREVFFGAPGSEVSAGSPGLGGGAFG